MPFGFASPIAFFGEIQQRCRPSPACTLLLAAFIFAGPVPPKALSEVGVEALMKPGELPELSLGSEASPVTVVEYASMSCGHCATFSTARWPAFKAKYVDNGKVRFVFREMPLGGNIAIAAAMLVRCAPSDKQFQLIERLFETQDAWATIDIHEGLLAQAAQAGFTRETFDGCLADQALRDRLKRASERANHELGISTVPTLFVNGRRLVGETALQQLEPAVAGALSKAEIAATRPADEKPGWFSWLWGAKKPSGQDAAETTAAEVPAPPRPEPAAKPEPAPARESALEPAPAPAPVAEAPPPRPAEVAAAPKDSCDFERRFGTWFMVRDGNGDVQLHSGGREGRSEPMGFDSASLILFRNEDDTWGSALIFSGFKAGVIMVDRMASPYAVVIKKEDGSFDQSDLLADGPAKLYPQGFTFIVTPILKPDLSRLLSEPAIELVVVGPGSGDTLKNLGALQVRSEGLKEAMDALRACQPK